MNENTAPEVKSQGMALRRRTLPDGTRLVIVGEEAMTEEEFYRRFPERKPTALNG